MSERELNLHPDAAAFLDELAGLEIPSGARARYEFLCARFAGPRVDVGQVVDLPAPVRSRLFRHGPGPFLLWFHGGRFISGSLDTHDDVCRRLAVETDGQVLSVDYRLAPENPHPAAIEDALTAAAFARTLHNAPAAGGDSAGAALALACGLDSVALVYPMLDPACDSASHRRFQSGPGPSSDDMRAGWRQFLPAGAEFQLPTAHIRRALVVTAEADPLLDEGLSLLTGLPAPAHLHFHGHIHGFLTYPSRFTAAHSVIERIGSFLCGA